MQKKEAALHRGNDDSAQNRSETTKDILAQEYAKATTWAAVLLGISFGAMIALGILLGW